MAKAKTKDSPLVAEPRNDTIPPIVYGEQGYLGLSQIGGVITEQCQKELRWPQAGKTYQQMMQDGVVAAAAEMINIMIAKPDWVVKIPEGYEDQLKPKAKYLEQCMTDMDHTWKEFIKQAATAFLFGFSTHEIVLRYRRIENGSRYNDGLVGIKKLPIRSQDTISKWEWSKDTRTLKGLWQNVSLYNDDYTGWDFIDSSSYMEKFLKRKKFLLFRNNPYKDNPVGKSPLDGAYIAWRYKTAYQKVESTGVSSDVHGFKLLYIPWQYLDEAASEAQKKSYDAYKKALANMDRAKQSAMILPLLLDENGNRMFDFDVKNLTGTKAYDVDKIISRYTKEILTTLFADFLALGSNGSGSHALADTKLQLVEMVIESKLNEIKDQLNHQLVRTLFEENGWSTEVMPYFDYTDVIKPSFDEIGQFIQRVSATGNFPRTPETINWLLKFAGIPYEVDDDISDEDFEKLFPNSDSKSGEGMSEGLNNGTGKSSGGSGDAATNNTK